MAPEKTLEEKLHFHYSDAPQRSPEWLAIKRGKIGSSRLGDWLAVSKAKTGSGKPLKARLDYEKELMFERQFGVSFSVFVSDAMQEGIDFEDFARKEFEKATGLTALETGCYYNDYFVASLDREVGEDGTLEIKIVKDNTFTEILMSGVPDKHWKQMQGQFWASGRTHGWYLALNFNTKQFVLIEVARDEEFIDYLREAVQEELVTEPFSIEQVHAITQELPDWTGGGADIDRSDSNTKPQDWSK